jgi:hypothetical protein
MSAVGFTLRALPGVERCGAATRHCLISLTVVVAATALTGCVAIKYQMTGKDSPPPVLLTLGTSRPPIDLNLRAAIIYEGPGSWKRDALWDEYVVTIRNRGDQPVTLTGASLVNLSGSSEAPGSDPWDLEKASQTLEQRYRRAGIAFARGSVPRAILAGASSATAASGGVIAGGVAAAAAVSVVALPVYYVVVWKLNGRNKAAVNAEFARRRIALPVTLAAGEQLTGSLFFPMVPSPQSLKLQWSDGPTSDELVLTLKALHGLHVTLPEPQESNVGRRTDPTDIPIQLPAGALDG